MIRIKKNALCFVGDAFFLVAYRGSLIRLGALHLIILLLIAELSSYAYLNLTFSSFQEKFGPLYHVGHAKKRDCIVQNSVSVRFYRYRL